MWSILRKTLIYGADSTISVIKETQRFSGHNKWSNIRHIKAQKDDERAKIFAKLVRQMRVAITEGGSCKPSDNTRLSQTIQQARRKNMPQATINAVLERATKSTTTMQIYTLDVRGPGGSVIVIKLFTDNLAGTKMLINHAIKKSRSTLTDQSARSVFKYKGYVVTEIMGNLDSATEDAIAVGAEDVEEIELDDGKYFQFICDANVLPKVANQLGSRNYKIISMEDIYVPQIFANLSDEDIERTEIFYAKLESFDEVVKIHDNIA